MIDDGGSKYLAIGKVAKHFGVDPHTVAFWCDKGWLAHIRVQDKGGRFKRQILKASVDEFEEKYFRPAHAEPKLRRPGRPLIYEKADAGQP